MLIDEDEDGRGRWEALGSVELDVEGCRICVEVDIAIVRDETK